MNPLLLTDAYKVDHRRQYPKGTSLIYSNWTPRKSRIEGIDKVVFFGLQYFISKYILDDFETYFFEQPKEKVVKEYARRINNFLGKNSVGTKHIEELHDLGYIPMVFKALPEGAKVPIRVPMFTMYNTKSEFFWLTNYFETLISTVIWMPCTTATIDTLFRSVLEKYAKETCTSYDFIDWQCHDFSMRGMASVDAGMASAAAHLLQFTGTDTIPAIDFLEKYYNANSDNELIGMSVPATEHSVQCMGTLSGELDTFRRLITEVYPEGIVSIVSDTWNLWTVLTDYLPRLKSEVMARNGKTVIRPDCYSDDTLILTPDGWKEFNQLTGESLVAQVNDDGSYSFIKPLKIVNEEYTGEMYHYKSIHGKMDLLVTPNHRMVYKHRDKWKIEFANECKLKDYEKYFLRSAKAENKHQTLTNSERLAIAFQADGSHCTGTDKKIRFSFSKDRKIQRLKSLLGDMEVPYQIYNLKDGRFEFSIDYSLDQVSKNFDWVDTSNLCSNWCQEFIEELSHWDSCIRNSGRIKFDTTNFSVLNVVELIALSAGYGCLTSKYEDNRKEIFSDLYTCNILLNNKLGGKSVTIEKVNYSGRIVCVTVPTGKIVVKRNRCTMVCGNSGNPVDIICGNPNGKTIEEQKGVIELLWEVFGGITNTLGYKELDSHIGAIYGDGITVDRATQICERLKQKGFASNNIVFGNGSYTYQYQTRDTFGFAMKATYGEVNGVGREIFKDPITDDGMKKSAKGLIQIVKDENGEYKMIDQVSWEQERQGELKEVFRDGKLLINQNLSEIRARIRQ